MAKNPENPEKNNTRKSHKKSPSLIKQRCKTILDDLKTPKKVSDQFPEKTRQETTEPESLDITDNIDSDGIDLDKIIRDLDKMIKLVINKTGEHAYFEKGVIKEDSIGQYILLNGKKCRRRHPNISGFAYKDLRRYDTSSSDRLEIGLFDKGEPKDYVIVNNRGTVYRPRPIQESKHEEIISSEETQSFKIDLSDICESIPTMQGDRTFFKEGVIQRDSIGNYFMINGMKCRELGSGISGLTYKIVQDKYHIQNRLEIGFYDQGELKDYVIIDDTGHANRPLQLPKESKDEKSL